jgi:hypothetical protein
MAVMIVVACALLLAGCVTTSEVVPAGKDTWLGRRGTCAAGSSSSLHLRSGTNELRPASAGDYKADDSVRIFLAFWNLSASAAARSARFFNGCPERGVAYRPRHRGHGPPGVISRGRRE